MLMVEVGEAPQHQACPEEGGAGAHFWDCLLLWTATAGWQAGPEMCCHFCLLEEEVGEGLIGPAGPSRGAGGAHWAGEAAAPSVQAKAGEVRTS